MNIESNAVYGNSFSFFWNDVKISTCIRLRWRTCIKPNKRSILAILEMVNWCLVRICGHQIHCMSLDKRKIESGFCLHFTVDDDGGVLIEVGHGLGVELILVQRLAQHVGDDLSHPNSDQYRYRQVYVVRHLHLKGRRKLHFRRSRRKLSVVDVTTDVKLKPGCNLSKLTMMTVMAKFNLVTPPKSPAAPITAIIPGSSHAHVSSPLRNKHEIIIIITFAYLMWRHAHQIELWRTMYCDVLYLRECPIGSLDSSMRTSRRGPNPRLYRTTHRISYKMHYTISIAFRKTQLAFKSPLKSIFSYFSRQKH